MIHEIKLSHLFFDDVQSGKKTLSFAEMIEIIK